ncbi:hypothetical protein CCUS01_13818 [Colletotrichum cuscutae]|uniref:C3H1-type domain-containing protein n=1 Tax=Colletotrichum cuscutae TaxID=1209917 RepID=A0AAJ0DMT4_9PEZI|nr:hypothetical protein CCUS01_13818 [Colletotrichum cuscutae]
MPSQEEQELLARIGQLAGKINLHKAQQAGVQSVPSSQASYLRHNTHRHGAFPHKHRVQPYPSTRGGPTGFRHRSLVVNKDGTQTPPSDASSPAEGSVSTTSSGAWISKNTRGQRSLINSAVYDKTNEAHVKAIEASRQQKIRQQDAREQQQLVNHFQRYSGNASASHTSTNPTATGNHEIEIQGIRFRVANSGSKLIKVSGDLHPVNATPKVAFVGGVKFHRSKTGNLYRDGVLKAQRGDSCDLSHDLTPQRIPTCVHFVKGNCANSACPYAHSSVSSGALVCRSFGMYGYCDKGDECEERHVFECPDFSNTGKCKTRGCKLLHRERASVLRKRADGDEMEDLSSDDEPVDSDDVDSDEVEEFITDGAGDDTDFKVQKDYISF